MVLTEMETDADQQLNIRQSSGNISKEGEKGSQEPGHNKKTHRINNLGSQELREMELTTRETA